MLEGDCESSNVVCANKTGYEAILSIFSAKPARMLNTINAPTSAGMEGHGRGRFIVVN